MDDDDIEDYGDTDPSNIPDQGGAVAPHELGHAGDMAAGDGLPGVPVPGCPGLRAGVFSAGKGLLGMARMDDLVARPGDDPAAMLQFGMDQTPSDGAGASRLLLASDPRRSSPTAASDGGQAYPMPPAYMPDGHGGVRLRPDFATAHPSAWDFGGMAKEIDWLGVVKHLTDILGGMANAKKDDWIEDKLGVPSWVDLPKLGRETWKAQDEANKEPNKPPQGADRVTNGLP